MSDAGEGLAHEPARSCLNCGTLLSGRFCASCGQAADVHVPTSRELVLEALEGITHSDSRLWRTLKLLWFSPGELTQEFIAGRRAAYLPPFRLYLVLSVVFFVTASLSPSRNHILVMDPRGQQVDCKQVEMVMRGRDWGPRIAHMCTEMKRDNGERLWHFVVSDAPKAMFIFVPLIALLHMLMYWRPRHRYVEHLLFFLHVHAFFFSVMTVVSLMLDVGEVLPRAGWAVDWTPYLLWLLPIYTIIAMRRVFELGWGATLAKGFALFAVYMVVLLLAFAGVVVYAALQL
jgi:hypothetical protein